MRACLVTQTLSRVWRCNPMDCSPPDSCLRDFPGEDTGLGCHFLLQLIFLTHRSILGHQHFRWILYHLNHQESLKLQDENSRTAKRGGWALPAQTTYFSFLNSGDLLNHMCTKSDAQMPTGLCGRIQLG